MKVVDCINQKVGLLLSIEVEPPKLGNSRKEIFATIDPLVDLGVQYVNITYHPAKIVEYIEKKGQYFAMHQRLKPGTSGMSGAILERYSGKDVFPIPHIICTGFSKYDTEDFLHELACLGATNVLVIRGDGTRDCDNHLLPFEPALGGNKTSIELTQQIAALRKGKYVSAHLGQSIDFGIGAACYPERHPDSIDFEHDFEWMQRKVDAGVEYFVTQMFFDCDAFEIFYESYQKLGMTQPMIPGLKPITTYRHLVSLTKMFQCHIPQELCCQVEKYKESKEDILKVGVDYSIKMCERLIKMGVPALHFYAARNAPIKKIIEELQVGMP